MTLDDPCPLIDVANIRSLIALPAFRAVLEKARAENADKPQPIELWLAASALQTATVLRRGVPFEVEALGRVATWLWLQSREGTDPQEVSDDAG